MIQEKLNVTDIVPMAGWRLPISCKASLTETLSRLFRT